MCVICCIVMCLVYTCVHVCVVYVWLCCMCVVYLCMLYVCIVLYVLYVCVVFLYIVYACVLYVCAVYMWVLALQDTEVRAFRNQVSPSTMWVLRIGLVLRLGVKAPFSPRQSCLFSLNRLSSPNERQILQRSYQMVWFNPHNSMRGAQL